MVGLVLFAQHEGLEWGQIEFTPVVMPPALAGVFPNERQRLDPARWIQAQYVNGPGKGQTDHRRVLLPSQVQPLAGDGADIGIVYPEANIEAVCIPLQRCPTGQMGPLAGVWVGENGRLGNALPTSLLQIAVQLHRPGHPPDDSHSAESAHRDNGLPSWLAHLLLRQMDIAETVRNMRIVKAVGVEGPARTQRAAAGADMLKARQVHAPDITVLGRQAASVRQPFQPLPREGDFRRPASIDIAVVVNGAVELYGPFETGEIPVEESPAPTPRVAETAAGLAQGADALAVEQIEFGGWGSIGIIKGLL